MPMRVRWSSSCWSGWSTAGPWNGRTGGGAFPATRDGRRGRPGPHDAHVGQPHCAFPARWTWSLRLRHHALPVSDGVRDQAPNLSIIWFAPRLAAVPRQRERELGAAQLEAELNRARLERLEAQLQPHFLFNTLNAISSLMYHDPARADIMLGRLSDLLRLTFDRLRPEVPWHRSSNGWAGTRAHAAPLRRPAHSSGEMAPETLSLTVPRLLLQPLVENALRHGPAKRAGPPR